MRDWSHDEQDRLEWRDPTSLGPVKAERDTGKVSGSTSAEQARIRELEREVRTLRQANEILRKASAYFAAAELDRPLKR